MAHKTLVGGTAYEIKGGKTLVNGTAYSIKNGKTLVGGTVYEVGFDDGMRTVTIIGGGSNYYCYVTIGGTKYYQPTTLSVPIGTVITCTAKDYNADYSVVKLNGQVVAGRSDNAVYNYTVTRNVEIAVYDGLDGWYESEIFITEQ